MPIELPPNTAAHSDRNEEPNDRQVFKLVVVVVGLLIGFILLANLLINLLIWQMPPEVEQQLGKLIVPVYERQAKPSPTQDALNVLLERLKAKLPAQTGNPSRAYQVLYIPEDTVNAAAIPGDRILIYDGLLQQVESENELMMILGHELGHFTNRDHLRGLGRGLLIQLGVAMLTGDPGSLQAIAVSGIAALGQAKFSQSQEKQADEVGLTLLNAVYGQVAGATDFFERMSRKEGVNFAILSTHPPSKERIQALNQLIQVRSYPVGERSVLSVPLKRQ